MKVAIKVLPPKQAAESEQALLRFRREMDLSQRVQHPNLARTFQVGEADGVHFMIMEYIPGDSLFHLVKARGGPLRVPDTARYFLKVLDGLGAAHAAGLIHRDIKPSNLMITPDGDAKILDLGLARALEDEHSLTRPNTVLGTLDYASPEQLSDAAKADRAATCTASGVRCISRSPATRRSRAAMSSTRSSSSGWRIPSRWSKWRGACRRRSRRSSAS